MTIFSPIGVLITTPGMINDTSGLTYMDGSNHTPYNDSLNKVVK